MSDSAPRCSLLTSIANLHHIVTYGAHRLQLRHSMVATKIGIDLIIIWNTRCTSTKTSSRSVSLATSPLSDSRRCAPVPMSRFRSSESLARQRASAADGRALRSEIGRALALRLLPVCIARTACSWRRSGESGRLRR